MIRTHIDDLCFCELRVVAHKIFGVPATINCANYVYFMALDELSKIQNPKMLNIFIGMLGFFLRSRAHLWITMEWVVLR